MTKSLLAYSVFLLLSTAAFGQAFLDRGYHPKATALGRAVAASTNDASYLFYNPASIGFVSSAQVFSSYTNLYPEITDGNLNVVNAGGSYALGDAGVVGAAVSQFAPKFWNEQIFIGSFASTMLSTDLSLGASLKLLRWSADAPQGDNAVPEPALSYTGFTIDAGAIYRIQNIVQENDLQVGASILNLTQPSVAANGSSDAQLPMEIHLAGELSSRKYLYTILGGAVVRSGELKMLFGYEINALSVSVAGIESKFLIRAGGGRVMKKDSQGEYNAGFGLGVERFTVDFSYSYQAFITHVGGITSIALGYEF